MKSYIPWTFSLGKQDADNKLLIIQQLKSRGTGRAPDSPRSLQSQAGSRGALLTWHPPETGTKWIRGWRIYKGTESNLHAEVNDPNVRQLYVGLSSGSQPPATNFFVSAITASGVESPKVMIQAQALTETGAPDVPDVLSE